MEATTVSYFDLAMRELGNTGFDMLIDSHKLNARLTGRTLEGYGHELYTRLTQRKPLPD